ncbi:glutamate-5-semialdehyde dehydrogenase [Mobilicoccus pelagius]|uniref:Gamma-glutamyl phosphate reductase n=1 Tax=Mobilicoccus pelagius NBRC 104925 TaxID=1089455 RepID=H5UQJ0_9MICO|nr:glutamate-5-semialdehyde dehydrogenase [Mobilicoccus pelagius]GAB47998.1 gamma-glutamyl phosphate reductase [Mobilicoccus pelagius NBRC 104925]
MTDETTPVDAAVTAEVERRARLAGEAGRVLAGLTRARKDAVLHALADALDTSAAEVLPANGADLAAGREIGSPESLLDRLRLDESRLAAIAQAVRDVAALPDPVGDVVRGSTLPNGLQIRQVRVPMGVVGMIYEARPNVTVDAAALALKSGNSVLLRGGSAAARSNAALVGVVRRVLAEQGLPQDAVASVDDGGREAARALMRAHGLVDVIIPRGGAGLIATVVRESIVPVIETGSGNCHVYVDAAADHAKARRIVVDAKTHRPSVCNAAETLLVHADLADSLLPVLLADLHARGVRLHGDDTTRAHAGDVPVEPATEELYDTEFHGLEMTIAVVDSLDAALDHVRRYTTGHTEAIVTEDRAAARRWTGEVGAAVVVVNASTRFTDGSEFGFGAEIGISTQKLHARGPMALPELTTTTWIVEGDGQTRGDDDPTDAAAPHAAR